MCAPRDAWTEAAQSSTGSAGPLDSLLLPFGKWGPLQNSDGLNKDYVTRDWLRSSSGASPFGLTWRHRVFQWTTCASRFALKDPKSGASSPDGPRPSLKDPKSGDALPLKDSKPFSGSLICSPSDQRLRYDPNRRLARQNAGGGCTMRVARSTRSSPCSY